jgi:hypothetical protein
MRKKTKMANICRSLRTKIFFSPVIKSPTHVEFTDVKKNGSKISHLGTFKCVTRISLLVDNHILVRGLKPKLGKVRNING